MVHMKILPSHSDWLENRRFAVGGSEIAAVLGLSPYMTNVDLWELKTGRQQRKDISDKPFVKYGTQAEMHLRGLFRLDYPQFKVEFVDNNSWTNPRYPWAQASLDGWLTDQDGRRGVLEIKTSEIVQATQRQRWHNQIPANYYCQVLFYMAVVEADYAYVKAQLKMIVDDEVLLTTKHYPIERSDVQDDIDYMMEQGERFWTYVEKDERPPLVLPNIL